MAGYSVAITATDTATQAIAKVNKALAEMTRPVTVLQKATGALSKEVAATAERTGLPAMARGLSSAAGHATALGSRISGVSLAIGALTSGLSLAGMARMVSGWADLGARANFAAQRIGISSVSLTRLEGAARLAGSSTGAMTTGLRTLGDTLTDAVGGRNMEAVQYLNLLGVSFRKNAHEARDVTDVLPELADRIAGIRNPFLQARVATALFGGAAEDLLPLLRRGSAGLREYQERAARLNPVTERTAQLQERQREAMAGAGLAITGLTSSLAERLAPGLATVTEKLTTWIERNVSAGRVHDWAKQLSDWLNETNWDEISAKVDKIAGSLARAAESVARVFRGIDRMATMPSWMRGRPGTGPTASDYGGAVPTLGAPSLGGGAAQPSSGPTRGGANNPGNIRANPANQWRGLTNPMATSGFASFATPEHGVRAATALALTHLSRGPGTLSDLISRWAPPNENNTAAYIRNVSSWTGIGPDQRVDPARIQDVMRAIFRQEGRVQPQDVLSRGVAMAQQPGATAPAMQPLAAAGALQPHTMLLGDVRVRLDIGNAPRGTTAQVATTGSVVAQPPNIQHAMPGNAP